MRRVLKRLAETVAVHGGGYRAGHFLRRGRGLILAYHNVVEDSAHQNLGDTSLHLPVERFEQQVELLATDFDVVSLDSLLGSDGGGGRPRVAITFDDAYRGAVTMALPRLAESGLPATVFVVPRFAESGEAFWWDRFERGDYGGDGDRAEVIREQLLTELGGQQARITDRARASGWRERTLPPSLCPASVSELTEASELPGVELGSHSWSHPCLPAVDRVRLQSELSRSFHWLRSRFRSCSPLLSYPYGRVDESVREAAASAGYRAAVTISGGWLPGDARQRPFSLPRLNVPAGLSDDGFALRLAGWLCD